MVFKIEPHKLEELFLGKSYHLHTKKELNMHEFS